MVEMPVMKPNRTSDKLTKALGWNFKKPILDRYIPLWCYKMVKVTFLLHACMARHEVATAAHLGSDKL